MRGGFTSESSLRWCESLFGYSWPTQASAMPARRSAWAASRAPCAKTRVPAQSSAARSARLARAFIIILQSHDVPDLGGRCLDERHLAVGRFKSMDDARLDHGDRARLLDRFLAAQDQAPAAFQGID